MRALPTDVPQRTRSASATGIAWRFSLAFAACIALGARPAQGARPFITDDARIVDHGACQAETWTQQGPDGNEYWLLPACNPTGNLELSLGGGVIPDTDGGLTPVVQLQAKTLFRPLEPGSFGFGLVGGSVVNSGALAEDTELGSAFAYVPLSVAPPQEMLVAHINGGLRWEAAGNDWRGLWGIGAEFELVTRLYAVGEVYGNQDEFSQIGLRLWLIPDHLQLDATYGRQLGVGREGEWFTVGMRGLTSPFFFLGSDS